MYLSSDDHTLLGMNYKDGEHSLLTFTRAEEIAAPPDQTEIDEQE
jgi:hypothetical protein